MLSRSEGSIILKLAGSLLLAVHHRRGIPLHLLVTCRDLGTQKCAASPAADKFRAHHLAAVGTLDPSALILDDDHVRQFARKLFRRLRVHHVLTKWALDRIGQQQSPAGRTGLNRNTHDNITQVTSVHRPASRSLPPQ